MALRGITRDQVLAAIDEYDALGQDGFLAKYGFDRSRSYLLVHDGKAYDSKAIVGAAHGVDPETAHCPLRSSAVVRQQSADCCADSDLTSRSQEIRILRN